MEIARSGKLGELRLFSSFFTHVVRGGDIRREPEVAGGATYDLGVYCINAARHLFDAEPTLVRRQRHREGRRGRHDERHPALPGRAPGAILREQQRRRRFELPHRGQQGRPSRRARLRLRDAIVHHLTIDEETKTKSSREGDQFAPELRYFSDCILEDREPEPSGEEGFCDVRVVEAILESARQGRPVTLAPFERKQRPTLEQADHARPVKKPKTVNAPSPVGEVAGVRARHSARDESRSYPMARSRA